jgi:16S rRNA (guanine(966)-N(2))-methyltransferase RsmD
MSQPERSMRVIAGTFKGRRLRTPTWTGLRPTSDKLRETLFNVLAARVPGARVLDLYAGTGALGIEALSRGAAGVTFVEGDRRAQALIARNLALCGIRSGYAIIRASVARGLRALGSDPAFTPFDIILLDPPYEQEVGAVLQLAGAAVAPAGIVVLEHAGRRPAPAAAGCLVRTRQIVSGDSALSLYETAADARTP